MDKFLVGNAQTSARVVQGGLSFCGQTAVGDDVVKALHPGHQPGAELGVLGGIGQQECFVGAGHELVFVMHLGGGAGGDAMVGIPYVGSHKGHGKA